MRRLGPPYANRWIPRWRITALGYRAGRRGRHLSSIALQHLQNSGDIDLFISDLGVNRQPQRDIGEGGGIAAMHAAEWIEVHDRWLTAEARCPRSCLQLRDTVVRTDLTGLPGL